jgi:hypothetical protein
MWSVRAGRLFGLITYAHARKGSVLMKTFYGLRDQATMEQAQKWVEEQCR